MLGFSACKDSLSSSVSASMPKTVSTPDISSFNHWMSQFAATAHKKNISQPTLNTFLKQTQYIPRVIALDRAQPDTTKTFTQYQALVMPKSRIQLAQKQYQIYKTTLTKVGKAYNVQPEFIVALWAIESDFGRNMGNFNTISALATLAYEGRRADFFKQELLAALTMVDKEHIPFEKMKGSWAGAMGQTQFMPSSFLELAVDYNGDKKRDIWDTKEDVFASIAHYLSKRGWNPEQNWGYEAKVPSRFNTSLLGVNTTKSIRAWSKLGVRPVSNHTSLMPSTDTSLIQPDKTSGRTYLATSNYKTLLQWNRSMYFATTVGMLADHIRSVP